MQSSKCYFGLYSKVIPRSKAYKEKENDADESANALYEGRDLTHNAFKRAIFPLKSMQGKGLKILTPEKKCIADYQQLLCKYKQVINLKTD